MTDSLLLWGGTNALFATALAAAVWLLTRLWDNPHVTAALWMLVLLKLLLPPLVTLPVAWEQWPSLPPAETVSKRQTAVESPLEFLRDHTTNAPLPRRVLEVAGLRAPADLRKLPLPWGHDDHPARWPAVAVLLLSVWFVGIAVLASRTVLWTMRLNRQLARSATRDLALQSVATAVAARLRLRAVPAARMIDADIGPCVWAGALQPLVIVPRRLWEGLGGTGRETLLAHEFAHLTRCDHWARRLEAVVLTLFWWLPTAWFVARRRQVAAEICCDAAVLAAWPDHPQAYAQALLAAVEMLSAGRPTALVSGAGGAAELKARLEMIVRQHIPRRPSRWGWIGLFALAAVTLGIGVRLSVQAADDRAKQPPPRPTPHISPPVALGGEFDGFADAGGSPMIPMPEAGFDESGVPDAMDGGSAGGGPALSEATRSQMVQSLVEIVQDETQPQSLRRQAVSSLGKIGGGSPDVATALTAVAHTTTDVAFRMQIAEARGRFGSPEGVAILWDTMPAVANEPEQTEETQTLLAALIIRLDQMRAVVPNQDVAVRLALLVGEYRATGQAAHERAGGMSGFGAPMDTPRRAMAAVQILRRTGRTADGLRLLLAAAEKNGTARAQLVWIIGKITPATDQVATALVEALSSDIIEIRDAAATALGNAGSQLPADAPPTFGE